MSRKKKRTIILLLDGSEGVHNSQFIEGLLTKLNRAVKLIGEPVSHE